MSAEEKAELKASLREMEGKPAPPELQAAGIMRIFPEKGQLTTLHMCLNNVGKIFFR